MCQHASLSATSRAPAFDIQVVWNQPMNQITFFAAITDTTPGIVTELLTHTGGDPASAVTGPVLTQTPAISSNTVSGFYASPYLRKTDAVPSLGC